MLQSTRIGNHIRHNVVGYVALFIALTMAPAWAASIGSSDIKKNAVRTKHIKDANVTAADLAADAVASSNVIDGSLTGADLLDGTLGSAELAGGAVGTAKLADSAVTSAKVADTSLTGADLAAGAVNTAQLADNAVNSAKVGNGTITDADLAPRENVTSAALSTCDGVTSWTTSVALAQAAGFWKDRSGVVHLQGSVACAGANATEGGAIFNLPAGYQPATSLGVVRWAALSSGGTISQIAVLDDGSGAVVYDGPDSAAADDYISLDGLTFRAEQ